MKNTLAGLALAVALTASARAAIPIPSDGSDGAFNPTADVTIDLSQATTGHWNDSDAAHPGKGIYDPDKWAVVFKYSSVNIPSGVTVTFKNHSPNAPIVWLVQGDVTIAGTVNLDGAGNQNLGVLTTPGPGGFRGGRRGDSGNDGSAGFGPGGGPLFRSGNYGDPSNGPPDYGRSYGNLQVLPLLGGSGSGGYTSSDGGAGGGAILIATGSSITVDGGLSVRGGYGSSVYGSGGAIRLISDQLAGTGYLNAQGGYTPGRIRIETNDQTFSGGIQPAPSSALPDTPNPLIWPPDTEPTLKMVSIGGVAVPADPTGAFTVGGQDVTLPGAAPVVVRLQAKNVPSTWTVYVRVVPFSGDEVIANATKVSGDDTSSVWEATISPSLRFSALQARAYNPNP